MYYYLVDADAPHGQVFWAVFTKDSMTPGTVYYRYSSAVKDAIKFSQEAKNLDVHPMMPITKEAWVKLVNGYLMDRSDGDICLQNYYDVFPNDQDEAERVAAETLVGEIRLVTIELA